jgi:transposase
MLFYEELVREQQDEGEEAEKEDAPPKPKKKDAKRTGRNRIPEDAPREEVFHDVAEEDKKCSTCQAEKIVIREERSEQLEYVPASLLVLEHVQPIYACPKGCEGQVVKGSKPAQPIEKGLAGPGLLAHVVTSKYGDHLPLNRQEDIFERHGVKISRQTQSELVSPLYDLMKEEVLLSEIIQTDDTPVKMQGQEVKSRMWVYLGDEEHPYTVFDHTRSRKRDGPLKFLGEYKGIVQADAYAGYDRIFLGEDVTEGGCWSHARRKYVEAETSDPVRSLRVVAWIKRLYEIEREAKDFLEELPSDLPPEQRRRQFLEKRKELREQKSRPLIEGAIREDGTRIQGLEDWLREQTVLPKSAFLDRPDLEMDNNASERALRQIAVGRNNWGLLGSKRGGKAAAIHYSLIHSCKRHGIDPFEYLRDVFTRIATHPMSRLHEFLPDRWKTLREQSPAAPTTD